MESPEIKDETESEDMKPADSSTVRLSSKKEPLVQATLSSMFKKAEEKKVRVRNHLDMHSCEGRFTLELFIVSPLSVHSFFLITICP